MVRFKDKSLSLNHQQNGVTRGKHQLISKLGKYRVGMEVKGSIEFKKRGDSIHKETDSKWTRTLVEFHAVVQARSSAEHSQ